MRVVVDSLATYGANTTRSAVPIDVCDVQDMSFAMDVSRAVWSTVTDLSDQPIAYNLSCRPQIKRDYPLNLSI